MTPPDKREQRRGRWQLLLLAAVTMAPLIVAYALYYSDWRPASVRHYGELVQPARPVGDVALTDLNGRQYQLSSLRGKWLYVYFGSARCAQHCQDVLYKTRQVILAQDKHQDRVQRLLVLTDAEGLADLASKLAEHPGLWVARPDAKVLDAFARDFHAAAGGALAGQDRVYLLDPLGNLMMSYAADADATGLRKDLARLLRVSRVG